MENQKEINFIEDMIEEQNCITYQFSTEIDQMEKNKAQDKSDFIQKVEIATRIYLKNLNTIITNKSIKNIPIQQNFKNVIQSFNTNKIKKSFTEGNNFNNEQISTNCSSHRSRKINIKKDNCQIDELASFLSDFWTKSRVEYKDFQNLNFFEFKGFKTFLLQKYQTTVRQDQCQKSLENLFEQLKFKNTKRHEENYKFLAKRFLKFLKQTKSLNLEFIIENIKIDFESYLPNEQFDDYFQYNQKKKQFIIKKANGHFFKIIFNHPVFYDYFFLFKKHLLQNCRNEAFFKFKKILSDFFKNKNFNDKQIVNKLFKLILNKKKSKLPWTYFEIENCFNFVCGNFQVI